MSRRIRDEKGLSKILIIVIIAVIIILVATGLIIWQLTKKTSTTTTTKAATNSSVVVSSACMKAFSDKTLCSFAGHTNIGSIAYIATGTAVNGSGVKSSYTVKHDGKGNTSVNYSTNGEQVSSIVLNGATYMQMGAGTTWLTYSSSSTTSAALAAVPNPVSGFNLNFNQTTPAGVTVNKVGTVTCGSYNCYKYQVKTAASPTRTQYVMFDTTNYLLRSWTYSDSTSGISVDVGFSYQSVTIVKPSPVKQITT
jgi:hypothetical protein